MTKETDRGAGGSSFLYGQVSEEVLMMYLDGELPPDERRRVEAAMEASTELRREAAIFRAMREDLAGLSFDRRVGRDSVWGRVNRRLTRPIGWILVMLGIVAWVAHFAYEYFTSAAPSWQKMATSAVVIGVLLLFASVIYDRYRELLSDPYRNVER
jgi:hypothetical protein